MSRDLKKILPEDSFIGKYPEVAKDWDYAKNEEVSPWNIRPTSSNKVWWKCHICGHEWKVAPVNRIYGSICPECNKRKLSEPQKGIDDFLTMFPEIASEWNYEKNGLLTPDCVKPGSNKIVWWRCSKCGYEWDTSINHRTLKSKATSCPACAIKVRADKKRIPQKGKDDLMSKYPEIVAEWDYEKNSPIKPDNVKFASNRKVYWICPKGHSYFAMVSYRTRGSNCPVCAGKRVIPGENDLKTTHPDLVKDWDFNKNGDLLPNSVSYGSDKKVGWKCHFCGHVWQTTISSRSAGAGCPKCSKEVQTSFPEQAIYYYIKKYFPDAVNSDIDAIGLELDIYIPSEKIAIEYDGVKWHNNHRSKNIEIRKNNACNNAGILLIRIREDGLEEFEDCAVCITRLNKHSNKELSGIITQLFTNISSTIKPDIDVDRDCAEIYSQYIVREKSLSLKELNPEVASEWHPEKNGMLTPDKVRTMSNKNVWWRCKYGHDYYMKVVNRTGPKKMGCPYCSGHKVLKGFNDLATVDPILAKEWDSEKNGNLTPEQVTRGYTKKVWWKCTQCGSNWQTPPCVRKKGASGCEKCNRKEAGHRKSQPDFGKDDILTLMPELASEWDFELNGELLPSDVKLHADTVIYWKCHKCGGKWKASANTRSSGCGCPYCAGKKVLVGYNDLATKNPELAKQWNYEMNSPITPKDVTTGTQRKFWWTCAKGHKWESAVLNRNAGSGCPYCSNQKVLSGYNDFATRYPHLLKEWNFEKDTTLDPYKIITDRKTKVWWKCSLCSNEWQAYVVNRQVGLGCPACGKKRSKAIIK